MPPPLAGGDVAARGSVPTLGPMSTEPAPVETPEDLTAKLLAILGRTEDRRRELQLLRAWDSEIPAQELDLFRPYRRAWMSTMRLQDMEEPALLAFEAEMKVGRHSIGRPHR